MRVAALNAGKTALSTAQRDAMHGVHPPRDVELKLGARQCIAAPIVGGEDVRMAR